MPQSCAYNSLPALRVLFSGNVDDGKSTLLGRLFYDAKALKNDQLQRLLRHDQKDVLDFAKLSDGLRSETAQNITIDVAHYYLDTPHRRFILLDTPGHIEYTRNMVTAATTSDAAVILVDATEIDWQRKGSTINKQTRRHIVISLLLGIPSIIFAINKLDATSDPAYAFLYIKNLLEEFVQQIQNDNDESNSSKIAAILPISALYGFNVVHTNDPQWTANQQTQQMIDTLADVYFGGSLLNILSSLSIITPEKEHPLHFPIQWIDPHTSSLSISAQTTSQTLWGRIATGRIKTGENIMVMPAQVQAKVVQIKANALNTTPLLHEVDAGQSAGLVLQMESPSFASLQALKNISRGDWLAPVFEKQTSSLTSCINATLIWLDETSLNLQTNYWIKHQHTWCLGKITAVTKQLNIESGLWEPLLSSTPTPQCNEIVHVDILLQNALPIVPYKQSHQLGAFIVVDAQTYHTAAAGLVI